VSYFRYFIMVTLILFIFKTENIYAFTIMVSSVSELTSSIHQALPGDTIIVKDGNYSIEGINIICAGTETHPIVIAAETIGGVEIKGSAGFNLDSSAAYVVINGFRFTHATGTAEIKVGAAHCKITHNIYECAPAGEGNKPYLSISGDDNEISYNTFQNKNTEGCMITVQGPDERGSEMAQRTWIHHNYFYNFEPTANNCSAIQIGLSTRSLSPANSIVEYNLFIKTRGENEGCICNKSCNNIYRYNTFGEGSTELSLRHGNYNEVYNNFFIGNTGVRFCGDNQKIYNNYFQGCSFAINCVNGDGVVPPKGNDKLTSHDRPDSNIVVFNTLVDNKRNFGMPARKNGLGATDITFADNIIQGGSPISISSPYKDPVWKGNIIWNTDNGEAGDILKGGYKWINPQLEKDSNGIYHIKSTSPAIEASSGSYSFVSKDFYGIKRPDLKTVGAQEYSSSIGKSIPLTVKDVGAFTNIKNR
jgi:poly(beta-D-mannuronate) lyase